MAAFSPESWELGLVAFHDGRPIGVQAVLAKAFAADRTVATGSWLGRAFQGQGLGTEMRAAVLTLAFAGLGAAARPLRGDRGQPTVARRLSQVRATSTPGSPR